MQSRPGQLTALAVVVARGGSKGIPLKALALVDGKPLVARSIEHARAARLLRAIVLSSDNQLILDIGRRYGIDTCERPAELASDTAAVDAAVRHAVILWEAKHDARAHQVVILYGNVPFRPLDLIDRALCKLTDSGADSVESVCPVGKMHPYWMHRLVGPDSDVLELYEPNNIYRRQDLPPVYMQDAGVIAVTRKSLFDVDPSRSLPDSFLGRDRRAVLNPRGAVIDVDDYFDLAVAQTLAASHVNAA
jgi:CMP-N-acetylneuraminic acid synthetase